MRSEATRRSTHDIFTHELLDQILNLFMSTVDLLWHKTDHLSNSDNFT